MQYLEIKYHDEDSTALTVYIDINEDSAFAVESRITDSSGKMFKYAQDIKACDPVRNDSNQMVYEISVYARDSEGLSSGIEERTFVYDYLPNVYETDRTETADTVTFSWRASDPDGTVQSCEYRKDGGDWTPIAEQEHSWQMSEDGEHLFEVRATDNKGYSGEPLSWYFNYQNNNFTFNICEIEIDLNSTYTKDYWNESIPGKQPITLRLNTIEPPYTTATATVEIGNQILQFDETEINHLNTDGDKGKQITIMATPNTILNATLTYCGSKNYRETCQYRIVPVVYLEKESATRTTVKSLDYAAYEDKTSVVIFDSTLNTTYLPTPTADINDRLIYENTAQTFNQYTENNKTLMEIKTEGTGKLTLTDFLYDHYPAYILQASSTIDN